MQNHDPRSLIKFKSFLDRFYHFLRPGGECQTHMQSYTRVEEEYYAFFGTYKYSDYYSFKSMKSKYIKSLKNK